MIHTLHRLKEFLKYQHSAKTKYYLHSPFVYQFALHILSGVPDTEIQNINKLRKKLLQNHDKIKVEDHGAIPGTKERIISSLAAKASVPHVYGIVLYNLIRYFRPQVILELGTCLGLGTAYMASADPAGRITTIEGSDTLASLAENNFAALGLRNINLIRGNFDDQLPATLKGIDNVDLAFIDGNHRYEPTMRYFHLLMEKAREGTLLIFDDIYWSPDMTKAWTEIKKDTRITLTIDIHRFGIAFINHEKLAKEDFILRY